MWSRRSALPLSPCFKCSDTNRLTASSTQRIRQWYNNHSGVRAKKKKSPVAKIHTSGKAPRARDPFAPVLLGGGADRPKQKLQRKQAYGVMLGDTSLKSDIEEEWKEKIVAEPELAAERGGYLRFFTMRVGQKYDAETPEVKAQVDVFREEEHKKSLASSAVPPLLFPHEEGLPLGEKAQLLDARTMQR